MNIIKTNQKVSATISKYESSEIVQLDFRVKDEQGNLLTPLETTILTSIDGKNFFNFLTVRFIQTLSFVNPIPGTQVYFKPIWKFESHNLEGQISSLLPEQDLSLIEIYNKINPIFKEGGVYNMGELSNSSILDYFAPTEKRKIIFKEDAKLFNNDVILGGNNANLTVVGEGGVVNYNDTVLICNSTKAVKGEAKGDGPVWGDRQYNVTGKVHNFDVLRAGDWDKGREGHGLYFNVGGDLEFFNCNFIECGAQGLQLIYRTTEGMGLAGKFPAPGSTISIEACYFENCGQITAINPATNTYNHNERASYPVTIGGWTENVEIRNCEISCSHPKPYKKANPTDFPKYYSKGALVVWNGGNPLLRTNRVVINDLKIFLATSDRVPIRLQGINEVYISNLLIEHSENFDGYADISIAGDVDKVFINPQKQPIRIITYTGASESGSSVLANVLIPEGKSCNVIKGVPTIF